MHRRGMEACSRASGLSSHLLPNRAPFCSAALLEYALVSRAHERCVQMGEAVGIVTLEDVIEELLQVIL